MESGRRVLQKSDAKSIAMLGFPVAEASLCALVLGLPGIAFESQRSVAK
jgi:hypothetical protein